MADSSFGNECWYAAGWYWFVWNVNFNSFEKADNCACFMMHLCLCSSRTCWLSASSLCSWQTNTCFLIGYLSWDWCLQVKSCWHFPSLCLPVLCEAPGNRHWKQKPFLLNSWNYWFGAISVNFLHAKYWTIWVALGPFVATWSSVSSQK